MERPIVQFPSAESVGEREWGEETLLVLSPNKYTMKKLFIRAGSKGGLQYHRRKDEAGLIISGEMILRYENHQSELVEKKIKAGDWFHFPTGCIHQEIAITDVVIIEVSTPHFNDRVRAEHMFGIEESGGLPTTEEHEIQYR